MCRSDTFSLGVCNGCQLMALLGWIPGAEQEAAGRFERLPDLAQPRFVHNDSGRFESRWATVTVLPGSPAVLLKVCHISLTLATLRCQGLDGAVGTCCEGFPPPPPFEETLEESRSFSLAFPGLWTDG